MGCKTLTSFCKNKWHAVFTNDIGHWHVASVTFRYKTRPPSCVQVASHWGFLKFNSVTKTSTIRRIRSGYYLCGKPMSYHSTTKSQVTDRIAAWTSVNSMKVHLHSEKTLISSKLVANLETNQNIYYFPSQSAPWVAKGLQCFVFIKPQQSSGYESLFTNCKDAFDRKNWFSNEIIKFRIVPFGQS